LRAAGVLAWRGAELPQSMDREPARGAFSNLVILAGQLSAPGRLHRPVIPRWQDSDPAWSGLDPRAAGRNVRDVAGAAAKTEQRPFVGPLRWGESEAPARGSGTIESEDRAQPGRLRGVITQAQATTASRFGDRIQIPCAACRNEGPEPSARARSLTDARMVQRSETTGSCPKELQADF